MDPANPGRLGNEDAIRSCVGYRAVSPKPGRIVKTPEVVMGHGFDRRVGLGAFQTLAGRVAFRQWRCSKSHASCRVG